MLLVVAIRAKAGVVVTKALLYAREVTKMSVGVRLDAVAATWAGVAAINAINIEVIDSEFAVTASCSDVAVDIYVDA